MQFRQHQLRAHARTVQLLAWFALLLAALTLSVNLLLALAYKLLMPLSQGFPTLFFETNAGLIVLFVLGGALVESQRLREGGGQRVARWLGGREVPNDPDDALERRLLNVVDEMAIASGQAIPQVFVLPREDAINAFVAGWSAQDMALSVTRGALERLTRAELQGLVAHEFGHIKEDDLPLSMRMLALVWGLSLVHGYGHSLMSADERGHVNPLSWLVGLVFAGVGWMGWVAGRMLQAAVSRQREFLADASAVQFTRSKDGLSNVLRKLWHDQQVLAGRMRHPAAGMVASLLMHQPGGAQCMSTHPRLSERIRRVCGQVLGPLPAPLLRLEAVEPRHSQPPQTAPGVLDALALIDPIAQASQARQLKLNTEREAWERLQRLAGPTELRVAVLALMMNAGNHREERLWRRAAEGVHHADRILSDVAQLSRGRRVLAFERLTQTVSEGPREDRRTLVELGRDLLRSDGRVSPRDRLWWLALRHRMGVGGQKQQFMRPMTGQGKELGQLEPDERAHVVQLSAYLARIVPQDEGQIGANQSSTAWLAGVMRRCGHWDTSGQMSAPDADALMHALSGVQELSWMIRPMLLKAWVEEAVNHSPQGMLSDDTADALRLMAGLIDSPLPPMLDSHYAAYATH